MGYCPWCDSDDYSRCTPYVQAEAFKTNDQESRRELQATRKTIDIDIRQAEKDAGDEIFRKVNRRMENTIQVDLHGLHVAEAIAQVDKYVGLLLKLHSNVSLNLITGQGKHSDGDAKLKPALKRHLASRGMPCFDKVGSLVTRVTPSNTD